MRPYKKMKPNHSHEDWRNQNKSGENFRKFILFSSRFESSSFIDCNFTAVDAELACFINTDLTGCDFTGANLQNANFGGANLTNVNFKGAILIGANFEDAIIENANFCNTSIKLAKNLKLSDDQNEKIELEKKQAKERTVADLAARKAREAMH